MGTEHAKLPQASEPLSCSTGTVTCALQGLIKVACLVEFYSVLSLSRYRRVPNGGWLEGG